MYYYKSKLNKVDEKKVRNLITEIPDLLGDFYITRSNIRLHIRENIQLLFESISKGDKIAYNENGVIITTGFGDNFPRHYIKILTKDNDTASKLIQVLLSNLNCDLWCKIKRNNPVRYALYSRGFKIHKGRGKEMLLLRKSIYKGKEK